jgi:hypothetical protein
MRTDPHPAPETPPAAPRAEPRPDEEVAHPAPDIEHRPEPDAENLIPVKHEPGTF